ncbi:thioredoxin-domain-containing protein [Teratosphaeria nubilosa]|uniref:Thioredoxin-domain-containing protein n=1 Tax=Teratosphaeria nubilosa TaxID=161662 RepID=A0A6G1KWK6_9PEZI|nr:thioredoxin-domain-containing protein [Teratosphaeria nubilosa]
MSKVIEITSSAHFKSITSSSTYTIVDFYADWCGPCKVISPIFEQLAAAESKPGRIVFCKVNVDNQRDVAGTYGISAMPTFLILKGSSVKETVRGANATALRTAVLSAAADAAKAPAKTSTGGFTGKGQTLGSTSGSATSRQVSAPVPDLSGLLSSPAHFAQGRGLPQTIVRFLGLYFSTLFSLEPVKTAEESPFAIRRAREAKVGGIR